MRKAETLLAALTAALALIALAFSLTQQAVEYISSGLGSNGEPGAIWADPITQNVGSAPVVLVGVGALLACLGAVVDARIQRWSRAPLLAMVIAGAIFCAAAVAVTSTANIWLYAERLSSDPLQPLPAAAQLAQVPHVSLAVLYAPVAVVCVACAVVALSRHQSRQPQPTRKER